MSNQPSGTFEQQIAIFCGAKYPRKMKKQLYGTRRQRRRFSLKFIRAFDRQRRKPPIKIVLERVDVVMWPYGAGVCIATPSSRNP